jgi:dTDP-4-dehydrorhamnose 3,5-epimerase
MADALDLQPTPLAGLLEVHRLRREDERGFLARLFCDTTLRAHGWPGAVQQVNHTRTERAGCVRGMHFQHPPHAEAKLVSCLRGRVFDVAVDLRAGSPTFLHWHAALLSPDNGRALLIPPGFAHGFQALEDGCELLYCHSAPHVSGAEGGLHPLDEQLAIAWPLPVAELSARDRAHPRLTPAYEGVAA